MEFQKFRDVISNWIDELEINEKEKCKILIGDLKKLYEKLDLKVSE